VTAARARLLNRDPEKIRHVAFEPVPDPDRQELRGRVFEAGDLVEHVVVELLHQRIDGGLQIGEIDHPAELRIERAAHGHFPSKRVPVHAPALVAFGHLR
jgi:hypothetical protein